MLRKSQDTPITPSTNRNTLPTEEGIRSLSGIKELFSMAKESRGTQVELSWTTKNPDQIFVLDVQWDAGKPEPFLVLYEENAGASKRLWAQPFSANNVEMFYDILVMSCGAVDHSKNLSEILKAKPNSEKEEPAKTPDNNSSSTAGTGGAGGANASEANAAQNAIANPVNTQNAAPNMVPSAAPVYPAPANGAIPPNPLAGFPMQAYNMPPYMQPMPIPVQYPVNPALPAGAWPYPPYAQPGTVPAQAGAGSLDSFLLDNALLNKQNDVGLIDLLIKAELLSEPILAAALRMRDLVLSKNLNMEEAISLLKRDHNKGGAIGSDIQGVQAPIEKVKSVAPKTNNEKPPMANEQELAGCLNLLEKAGLLGADDIKTAKAVSKKHGGNLTAILGAANKLDNNTLEAAKICHALEQEGLFKLEQCVIVLNYCSRSRVSFDEAISELNWENPRKKR